ncbi:MAG: peptidoglycan DD-metalloendopeptidase family protein [Kofleriaceae bacterium]
MIDAQTYDGLRPVSGEGRDEAALQLEAFFLRRLLAEARPQGDALTGGGMAGDTFRGMLDEAIADKMAECGGIGLARAFGAQFDDEAAPTTPDLDGAGAGRRRLGDLAPLDATALRLHLPVSGRTSSAYGVRIHPVTGERSHHAGLDLAAPTGTPVEAAAAGVVVRAESAGTYGNLVVLRHPDGLETRYAHLSAIAVATGQHVRAGDTVGAVGATGRATGPHLHFEVRREGVPQDPTLSLPPLNDPATRPTR